MAQFRMLEVWMGCWRSGWCIIFTFFSYGIVSLCCVVMVLYSADILWYCSFKLNVLSLRQSSFCYRGFFISGIGFVLYPNVVLGLSAPAGSVRAGPKASRGGFGREMPECFHFFSGSTLLPTGVCMIQSAMFVFIPSQTL